MRSLIAAGLLLASVGAVCANPPIVIGNDPGGQIDAFLQKYEAIREAGTPVILTGDCVSACTLVVRLPRKQVCAMPGARLGFHGASVGPGGPYSPTWSHEFAKMYPASVRKWFNSTTVHFEPATDLVRACR